MILLRLGRWNHHQTEYLFWTRLLRITVSVHQGWQRIGIDEQVIEIEAEPITLRILAQHCGAGVEQSAYKVVRDAIEELARLASDGGPELAPEAVGEAASE